MSQVAQSARTYIDLMQPVAPLVSMHDYYSKKDKTRWIERQRLLGAMENISSVKPPEALDILHVKHVCTMVAFTRFAVLALAAVSIASRQPNYSFQELWDLQNNLLAQFIYPSDVAQAEAINSTLLSEDIVGRIDVTEVFLGRELK